MSSRSERTGYSLSPVIRSGVLHRHEFGYYPPEPGRTGGTKRRWRVSEQEETGKLQEMVEIRTPRGTVRGVLHPAKGARGAIVMVGGAGGGIHGPAGAYEELAERLQADSVVALRIHCRQPNNLDECIYGTVAAINSLGGQGAERAVLVGWSFGGAVVITAGATSDAAVGVATVARQTYGTEAVGELAPKSLLLIHGTADDVLPYHLSQYLYNRAGEAKELVLYPDDDHGINRHRSEMLEKLHSWARDLLLGGPEYERDAV